MQNGCIHELLAIDSISRRSYQMHHRQTLWQYDIFIWPWWSQISAVSEKALRVEKTTNCWKNRTMELSAEESQLAPIYRYLNLNASNEIFRDRAFPNRHFPSPYQAIA
jgi:hypothetical protein